MRWLFLVAAALALVSCGQPENARIQVLIGGTLVDGRGGDPVEHSVVIIEDDRIRAAGSQVQTPIPAGSKKVNTSGYLVRPTGQGATILPGEQANLELVKDGSVARKMVAGRWQ